MSKRCLGCGEGHDYLCASCNREMRQRGICPVCFGRVAVVREGRRVIRVHPRSPCRVWQAGPWYYTSKGLERPYIVPEGWVLPGASVEGRPTVLAKE